MGSVWVLLFLGDDANMGKQLLTHLRWGCSSRYISLPWNQPSRLTNTPVPCQTPTWADLPQTWKVSKTQPVHRTKGQEKSSHPASVQEMPVVCWAQANRVIRQRQCKVSPILHMSMTACIHTFGEEADRVTPNVSCAEQPVAMLSSIWSGEQPRAESSCMWRRGRRRLHSCFPSSHSEHPALADLSPKTWSQIKQKGLIKPPNLSPLRSSLNTCKLQPIQAPQVAFCLLQGTAYIPGETANGMLAGQLCPLSLNMPAQQWGEGQGKPTKKSWCSSGDCSPAWKLCQARCGYCPGILFPCPQNRPSMCHSHPSAPDRRAIISHFSHAVPLCLFTFMTIPLLILLSQ